ncbi:hypothetical protein, partial [Enterobacter asburiae]
CLASIVAVRSGALTPALSHTERVKKQKTPTAVSGFGFPAFRPFLTLFQIYYKFKQCYETKQLYFSYKQLTLPPIV